MRKVKFVVGYNISIDNMDAVNGRVGFFHGFFQEGDMEEGTEPIAVVEEAESGEVFQVGTNQLLFTDSPVGFGENQSCVKCQFFVNGQVCNQTVFEMFMEDGHCDQFKEVVA